MGKGTFKYICDDCQAENWLSSKSRSSRFKPRCTACGSPWLYPSKSSVGPKKTVEISDASREQTKRRDERMNIDRSKKNNDN